MSTTTLPTPALWDGLLAAGGPAAALALLPHHWAELQASAIAPDVAAANVASFGPGTDRHWESERAALVAHARLRIQTESTTASGHPQGQAGFLADRLIRLDSRYRHLSGGGWRSLSDALPGLPGFDQWKPDQARPRADKPGQAIKYEAPPGFPDGGGLLLPRVPDRCWALICERQGLPFPDAAARADGFWAWALATPALQVLICEGLKKALAAISAGWAAVAVPGVQMGRRRDVDGSERLIAALQLLGGNGRPWLIAFDAERKPATAAKVGAAAGALAWSLRAAGGRPEIARLPLLPGTTKTGLDDLLAAAGPEALDRALANTGPRPVLPDLRRPDRIAPAGHHLGVVCPIPAADDARLVALSAPMGAGKTEAIAAAVAPLLAEGVRVVLITHRRSLGAALADRLGLPWAGEAAPGSDLRQQGVALCIDSLCPGSGMQIRPEDWRGCVVVIDEAAAVLAHALNGIGTAIATRRPAVLETLGALLAGASQVIVADAQLSEPVLQALETATGADALLIGSEHRPAAGRRLVVHPTRKSWRAELVAQLQARRRLWIASTAAQPGSPNSAQNLALLALQHWPTARVLVVDATTVADDGHDAARLAGDPDGIAGRYDVVITSPAVAAGLSVTLRGHFDAVMVGAGGTTDPDSVAQAAARVRDDCHRHLYAPERSPGNHLNTGSGDTDPAQLLRRLSEHEAATVSQLVAAGVDLERNTTGPWLPLWARLGAARNSQRLAYRSTVRALLEREGYDATEAAPLVGDAVAVADAADEALKAIATEAQAADDAAVIAAEPLTEVEARELARKRKRSPAERAQLARHRVAKAWGLGADAPTTALLEADRDGRSRQGRFGWILRNLEARQLVAKHDQATAAALAPDGRPWAPDLCRETVGPKVTAADALGLADWLGRGDWFTATDAQLQALQALAIAHGASLRQVLGVSPGKRATTTLRALLALAGFELEPKRTRGADGQLWRYRVKPIALPDGADRQRLEAAWRDQLADPGGG